MHNLRQHPVDLPAEFFRFSRRTGQDVPQHVDPVGITVLQGLHLPDSGDSLAHQAQDAVGKAFNARLHPEEAGLRQILCVFFRHIGLDFRKQPELVITVGVPLQQCSRQLLLVGHAQDIVGEIALGAGIPAGQFRQFIRKPVRAFCPVQMGGASIQPTESTGMPGRPPAAPGTFRRDNILPLVLRQQRIPLPEVIAEIRQGQSVQILCDSRRFSFLPGA